MYRWALAALIVLGCGAALKPPEPNRRLELHTGGSVFESSAGFRFASLPEPRSGVVRVDVRYPVGSVDDPPGEEGLARLVAPMSIGWRADAARSRPRASRASARSC